MQLKPKKIDNKKISEITTPTGEEDIVAEEDLVALTDPLTASSMAKTRGTQPKTAQ
jgi:hypothetical protein